MNVRFGEGFQTLACGARRAVAPRRLSFRLALRNSAAVIRRLACLAILLALAACSTLVETDQARLCRMALPALAPSGATVAILKQREFADGRGLRVDYRLSGLGAPASPRFAECRFKAPGRPERSEDMVSLTTNDGPLSDVRLYMLIRFWLATPEGRAADPAPLREAPSCLPVASVKRRDISTPSHLMNSLCSRADRRRDPSPFHRMTYQRVSIELRNRFR